MNTLRLIRWRGERHASITQRLNFAAHATPEATLALVYAHESGLEPDEVRRARRAYGGNTIPAPDVFATATDFCIAEAVQCSIAAIW